MQWILDNHQTLYGGEQLVARNVPIEARIIHNPSLNRYIAKVGLETIGYRFDTQKDAILAIKNYFKELK